jgi:uncharacterized membrane protein
MAVLSRNAYRWLITLHILLSVSLLGDSAGFLAIAIHASTLADPVRINESIRILDMLSIVFGIPLSFAAIITGITLGLGTKWGVFRYPWVVAKLALIISVMFVGGLVINPAQTQMLASGADATPNLIAAGAYDVIALSLAVWLSVFKPGRAFRSNAHQARPNSA